MITLQHDFPSTGRRAVVSPPSVPLYGDEHQASGDVVHGSRGRPVSLGAVEPLAHLVNIIGQRYARVWVQRSEAMNPVSARVSTHAKIPRPIFPRGQNRLGVSDALYKMKCMTKSEGVKRGSRAGWGPEAEPQPRSPPQSRILSNEGDGDKRDLFKQEIADIYQYHGLGPRMIHIEGRSRRYRGVRRWNSVSAQHFAHT